MLREFIDSTVKLLQKSDLNLHQLVIRKVEKNNELENHYMVHSESFSAHYLKIAHNTLFHFMTLFSVVDSIVDKNYPILEGETFSKRYKGLAASNDKEVMFKELYRIFKLIRNAIVHSKSALAISSGTLKISYSFKSTQFELVMPESNLTKMYALVLDTYASNDCPNDYKDGIMRHLYNEIINGITTFTDEFSIPLARINGHQIKHGTRYRLINATSEKIGDSLKVTNDINRDEYSHYYGRDYLTEYNGDIYLLPEEVLSTSRDIALLHLDPWKIG